MLGFTSLAVAYSRPAISPEASEIISRAGTDNTQALLEEFNLSNKAIYLPAAMLGGHSRALIPFRDTREIDIAAGDISGQLIVHYGKNLQDKALVVTTPGNVRLEGLEIKTGQTTTEIESTMTYVLVGLLDLASSVEINMVSNQMDIMVNRARLHYEDNLYHRCLGSPVASILAVIACESLQKPVRITKESYQRGANHVLLEVLS